MFKWQLLGDTPTYLAALSVAEAPDDLSAIYERGAEFKWSALVFI